MNAYEAFAKLPTLAPNTWLNARCPWKGDKQVTRMWCPCRVHDRQWVRLLVRSESDEVFFYCEGGCTQEEIEMFIFEAGARPQNWRQRPPEDPIERLM